MKNQVRHEHEGSYVQKDQSTSVKQVESRVDAEAEQGEGLAAASASSSASGALTTSTSAVSVAVSPYGAASGM